MAFKALMTQYPIDFCFRVGFLILIFLSGTTPDPDLTLTVPAVAYPGAKIQLSCYTAIPGLSYKWLTGTNITLSNSATTNYTFPQMTSYETKSFTCQILMGKTVVGNRTVGVTIALVNSVTFDIRAQDLNNLNEVVIQCFTSTTVSGEVALTWYFNTMQIVYSPGYKIVDNTLTITATDPARSGVYVCSATLNGMDSTKKSGSTTVQIYSPAQVSLEQPEGDVFNLLENSLFKITCNITGLETPHVMWEVNDHVPDSSSVIVLYNITVPGQ